MDSRHLIVNNYNNISLFLKNPTKANDNNAYGKETLFNHKKQQEVQPVFFKGRNFH